MLEIMQINGKEFQQRACSDLNIRYIPDSLAYCALQKGQVIALCQFTVKEQYAAIESLTVIGAPGFAAERTARDLLFAVLSYLDSYGVSTALCKEDQACGVLDEYISRFPKSGAGCYQIEIDGFFDRVRQ